MGRLFFKFDFFEHLEAGKRSKEKLIFQTEVEKNVWEVLFLNI